MMTNDEHLPAFWWLIDERDAPFQVLCSSGRSSHCTCCIALNCVLLSASSGNAYSSLLTAAMQTVAQLPLPLCVGTSATTIAKAYYYIKLHAQLLLPIRYRCGCYTRPLCSRWAGAHLQRPQRSACLSSSHPASVNLLSEAPSVSLHLGQQHAFAHCISVQQQVHISTACTATSTATSTTTATATTAAAAASEA
eukprot:8684-Heterococcus_DN1.PRE.2